MVLQGLVTLLEKGFSMVSLLSNIFLAFAVSIDNFGTGLTYGLRKIVIPFRSLITIGICSGVSLLIGVLLGTIGASFVSESVAGKFGGAVLIGIGVYALYNFFKEKRMVNEPSGEKRLIRWEIRSAGIVVEIMRKPQLADLDGSGVINGLEAIFLGLALSMDALGVGVSAALTGFQVLPLICIVIMMSTSLLILGIHTGSYFATSHIVRKLSFLPGFVLIMIGFIKFF